MTPSRSVPVHARRWRWFVRHRHSPLWVGAISCVRMMSARWPSPFSRTVSWRPPKPSCSASPRRSLSRTSSPASTCRWSPAMSSSPARASAAPALDTTTDESRSLWQRLHAWWEDREADINIRMWLGYAAGVLVVAALLREPILALLGLAVAVIGLILRLWWDHALDKLSYRRSFSETRAFWGDTVSVELTAENAKPLPISRLDVTEVVSNHVSIPGHELGRPIDASGRLFETLFSLGMYERVTHRFTL